MNFIELVFIAAALSMDAFAVSIACGISAPQIRLKNTFIVAFAFGFFQAAMPVVGWNVSEFAYEYIKSFDHWIAFFMLAFVAAKMIWDGLHESRECDEKKCFACPNVDYKILFLLAVATSLDALAVGVSFSCTKYPILLPSLFIGATTFLFSFFGVKFGKKIVCSYDGKFEIVGGIVLLAIGLKILITG